MVVFFCLPDISLSAWKGLLVQQCVSLPSYAFNFTFLACFVQVGPFPLMLYFKCAYDVLSLCIVGWLCALTHRISLQFLALSMYIDMSENSIFDT